MARQSYGERIQRGVEKYLAAHPDASYAEAKKFARGHGSTPEHGKIISREIAGRQIAETRSAQAGAALVSDAAASGQRITVTVTLKNGHVAEMFTNPKHGRGMDAAAMKKAIGRGNFKGFLAANSGKGYEGNEDAFDVDDIDDIQIEAV